LCGFKESDNLWWDAFATEFFEDDAMLTLSFSMEDGPKRYSMLNLFFCDVVAFKVLYHLKPDFVCLFLTTGVKIELLNVRITLCFHVAICQ